MLKRNGVLVMEDKFSLIVANCLISM